MGMHMVIVIVIAIVMVMLAIIYDRDHLQQLLRRILQHQQLEKGAAAPFPCPKSLLEGRATREESN